MQEGTHAQAMCKGAEVDVGTGVLVVASNNPKKLKELNEILNELADRVALVGAEEAGLGEVAETGATFEANAILKAVHAYEVSGAVALADDSGLEVDALGGAPGVRSARFAGEEAQTADNNQLLMKRMAMVPDGERGARYRCVIALIGPVGRIVGGRAITTARGAAEIALFQGSCEGEVVHEPRGEGGFGYDPFIAVPGTGKTFAELSAAEKHAISHRGQALRGAAAALKAAFE